MRYCHNCGKHACERHLEAGVYGFGDLCIDCAKTFKKSYYGIGNIWFKKKKGATEVNINKSIVLDIKRRKINKVFSLIKEQMKSAILLQSEKPNILNYIVKGREKNIYLYPVGEGISLKIEWKADYANMFSENDFEKFDKEFEKIIKKIKGEFKA